MRCSPVACVIVVILGCGFASTQPAAAQAMRPNPPPAAPVAEGVVPAGGAAGVAKRAVLLVMESAGGVRAAASLRASLNAQPGLSVVSLADVTQKQLRPAAIVTVAAVTTRAVSVVSWDFSGARDVLSAPTPARADQLDAVVLALASALLERHRGEWSSERPGTPVSSDDRSADALYAVLGRFVRPNARTNVALRFEDF
jgi:predicted kinase